jgi:hypothetical protein
MLTLKLPILLPVQHKGKSIIITSNYYYTGTGTLPESKLTFWQYTKANIKHTKN